MRAGWYIVNYHSVDWENSILTRALGGVISPDTFRDHLTVFSTAGELISVKEGIRRFESGIQFDRPAFSIWFDDGFSCVRKYALPICQEFGVTAAMAVNSRFVLRQEMFWYAKLSYLSFVDGICVLRSRLRSLGYDSSQYLSSWLIQNFSREANEIINHVYDKYSTDVFRQGAWKIFDDADGIRKLMESDWLISNHSAAHYPLTEKEDPSFVYEQFQECDAFLDSIGVNSHFYVLPFEYKIKSLPKSTKYYKRLNLEGCLVREGELVNRPETFKEKVLYRYIPITDYRYINGIPIATLNIRYKMRRFLKKICL